MESLTEPLTGDQANARSDDWEQMLDTDMEHIATIIPRALRLVGCLREAA